jgi:hypothetical protein
MSATTSTTATDAVSKISTYIPISYITAENTINETNVNFNITFGKGKDSLVYTNEWDLKEFTKKYEVETIENEETKCYYVIAEEGPFVIKIHNLNIESEYNNNNDYALGFALDFEEPEYFDEDNYTPFNIDRDGIMWSIPVDKNEKNNVFYQNAKAKYQWTASRSKNMGEELTEDEKKLGIEKTSETVGLIYLSIMILSKEKQVVQEREITRSSNTRSGGVSRGISNSVAARVGYGHSATSSSVASTFKHSKNTKRLVIPIRFRISKDSDVTDMNCSKTLDGAKVNMERKKITIAPFLP